MLIKAAVVLAVVVVALAVFVATRPATLRLERSIAIAAPPEKVFALVDDLHRWDEWQAMDGARPTRTFAGAPSGKGASSEWRGSGAAGAGKMEITESTEPSRIVVAVDFVAPFAAHNVNDFTFAATGNMTQVTWRWQGTNVLAMKVMSLFTSADKMIGSHFERSLANLKALAER
jgi:uncharacterized protein YndB with AHSA1/START domain